MNLFSNTLIFHSELDAQLVAEQVYNCHLEGNLLIVPFQEQRAVDLAISLVDVDSPIVEGASCLLPFPKHERECFDDDAPQIYGEHPNFAKIKEERLFASIYRE